MGQVLHGSATTTEAVRRAIQNSQESIRALGGSVTEHTSVEGNNEQLQVAATLLPLDTSVPQPVIKRENAIGALTRNEITEAIVGFRVGEENRVVRLTRGATSRTAEQAVGTPDIAIGNETLISDGAPSTAATTGGRQSNDAEQRHALMTQIAGLLHSVLPLERPSTLHTPCNAPRRGDNGRY